MRLLIVMILSITSGSCIAQEPVYNRLLAWKLSYTSLQFNQTQISRDFNDTSKTHQMNLAMQMPAVSYTHEFLFDEVFGLCGTFGWQYLNVFYDDRHLGWQTFFLSAAGKLNIVRRKNYLFYMKLKAGLSVQTGKIGILDDTARKLFPERIRPYGGVTITGFDIFLNPQWGLNMEVTLFAPELFSIGATYRFFRGDLPKIQGSNSTR